MAATSKNFRDWPSRHVVVTGEGSEQVTYVCYSPFPKALLASSYWLVERIDANGSNTFPTDSVVDGEMLANHAASNPAGLTYFSRS